MTDAVPKVETEMVVECPECSAPRRCKIAGRCTHDPPEMAPLTIRLSLVTCEKCGLALVAQESIFDDEESYAEWSYPKRLLPNPDRQVSTEIPRLVRASIEEALVCFKAGAFMASAVMCGRALEGVAKEHGIDDAGLFKSLGKLRDAEVIDKRLYEWGDALRQHRNIGAHATDEEINETDASDLLDFAIAICEYVFVLGKKFERFKERNEARNTRAVDGS